MPVLSPSEKKILGARIKNVFLVTIKRFSFFLSHCCIFVCSAVSCPYSPIVVIAQVPTNTAVGFLPPLPVADKPYYLRGNCPACKRFM